jgi:K+-transporting ATPase c subunit
MSLFDDASLAMIPSAYKDGKLYSIKPTDGSGDFTFTRGSNLAATRVDENGLIEKGRENLLLQSNQFDTTWANTNSITAGQSGYDGGSDAWQVDISAAFAQVDRISTSGVQTFSLYAKAGTLNWLDSRVDHSTFSGTYFDLANGAVGNCFILTQALRM